MELLKFFSVQFSAEFPTPGIGTKMEKMSLLKVDSSKNLSNNLK